MSFIPQAKDEKDPLERVRKDVERRRRQEEERKKRFFNDKQRIMGLDLDALAKQIEQKKQAIDQEKEEDVNYAKQELSFMNKLYALESERNKISKERAYLVGQYQQQTKKENADTWDLNDPTLNRNTQPPRLSDNDQIHPSSLQKFDGEDLGYKTRKQSQAQQLTQWCNQLENLKKAKIEQEKRESLQYDQNLLNTIEQSNEIEKEKERLEKQLKIETAKFNLRQKNEKNKILAQIKMIEENEKLNEINNLVNSDWLTENWDSTLRANYNYNDASYNNNSDNSKIEHRHIPYHFKGFNKSQRQEIMNQQKKQIEEHLEREKLEKENMRKENEKDNEFTRQALLQLRKLNRIKLQQNCQIAQTQQKQIETTKEQRQKMDEIYSNRVTEAYFSQFQTSAR